jgi:hypothetical protein
MSETVTGGPRAIPSINDEFDDRIYIPGIGFISRKDAKGGIQTVKKAVEFVSNETGWDQAWIWVVFGCILLAIVVAIIWRKCCVSSNFKFSFFHLLYFFFPLSCFPTENSN